MISFIIFLKLIIISYKIYGSYCKIKIGVRGIELKTRSMAAAND
jgi:hypothetical protein